MGCHVALAGVESYSDQANIASEKMFLTLYAQFHDLLTLNEVRFTSFSVTFITKEADVVHKIRNSRILLFFKLLASPEIRQWSTRHA